MSHPIEVQKIVLLPRYTSFSGAQVLTTAPINVRAFASATIGFWVGNGIGTTPTIAMEIQQSPDLKIWTSLSTFTGTPETEVTNNVTFEMEWVRLAITLTGTDPGFTGWCVGDFVTRAPRR
ncbi:MAG: hypothetical protein K8T90_18685 [Planctomycetes bacterium]|nr:hypothetical protein [Planctomycetota bacterium]